MHPSATPGTGLAATVPRRQRSWRCRRRRLRHRVPEVHHAAPHARCGAPAPGAWLAGGAVPSAACCAAHSHITHTGNTQDHARATTLRQFVFCCLRRCLGGVGRGHGQRTSKRRAYSELSPSPVSASSSSNSSPSSDFLSARLTIVTLYAFSFVIASTAGGCGRT